VVGHTRGAVLDAGALIAIDRGDRETNRILQQTLPGGVRTSCAAVAQVWCEGAKQARLALALRGIDVVGLDDEVGRRIGELLRESGTEDVVDGHVALLARTGDYVFTSDVRDIGRLLDVRRTHAKICKSDLGFAGCPGRS
jgi:hypothetical protein